MSHDSALGRLGEVVTDGVAIAGIAQNLMGPYMAPPSITVDPVMEPPAIVQEIAPSDCPALAETPSLDYILDFSDAKESELAEAAAETSEALEVATATEAMLDATPALDLGFDAAADMGADMGGGDFGGMA